MKTDVFAAAKTFVNSGEANARLLLSEQLQVFPQFALGTKLLQVNRLQELLEDCSTIAIVLPHAALRSLRINVLTLRR